MRDSDLWDPFATFFDEQTMEHFNELKSEFATFCKQYTPIRTSVEANRIFTKVLNPLACKYHKCGTLGGRLSPYGITFKLLSYNRENLRDVGKPKNVARRDVGIPQPTDSYFASKAKEEMRRFNKQFNDGASEVLGKHSAGEATQMHHIFPQSEFPPIAAFVENIISLTPSQHLMLAHPKNNTGQIDKEFQYQCLLAKSKAISQNILFSYGTPNFYSFAKFMFMLDTGFDTDYFQNIPVNDFKEVRAGIASHYD